MARSLFLVCSDRKKVNRLQFRRLGNRLGEQSLGLSGPCADRIGAVEVIADDVRKRLKSGTDMDPVESAVSALTPWNLPSKRDSWLKVPFIIGKGCQALDAGSVASSEPVEFEGGSTRVTDLEELTLLALGVLRRLGVESHYSYMHFGSDDPVVKLAKQLMQEGVPIISPCILVPGKDPRLVTLVPPYGMQFSQATPNSALEVLDDDALLSLLKIKCARTSSMELMEDVAEREAEFPDEGGFRARAIGHLLYSGMSMWRPEDAARSVTEAAELLSLDKGRLQSIRQVYEMTHVNNIMSPALHGYEAAGVIICEEILDEVSNMLMSGTIDLKQLYRDLPSHSCLERYMMYMDLAAAINSHIHPMSECDDMAMVH
jgi:hypothetical protein